MKHETIDQISRRVFRIYQEIEKQTFRVKRQTGMVCPDRCGQCCWSRNIEATVVEMIPLVNHILRSGRLNEVLTALDTAGPDDLCVFFRPDMAHRDRGFCSDYRYRPLVCRLFGFSARRNKDDRISAQVCRRLKQVDPEACERFKALCMSGALPPMRAWFQRIAAMDPVRGYRLMPVNQALRECIDLFFWRKPRFFKPRRAS